MTTLLSLCFVFAAAAKKPPPIPEAAWKPGEAASAASKAGNGATYAPDWPLSEASFREALAVEPNCGMAQLGLGRALVMQSRVAEALVPLSQASRAFPEQLDTHVWYARALFEAGLPAEAVVEAKAALTLKPGSVEAQTVAQRALRAEKRYAEAHEMVAAARGGANAVAWDCFDGVVYALEDRLGEATKTSSRCSGSPDPELYRELTTAIMEAVARAEAAAPPPEPEPPAVAPVAPKKRSK